MDNPKDTDQPKKRGRPPAGKHRGRPLTIYMSQPREELFEEAFDLLKDVGMLPSTATINLSRSEVIDHALDALIHKLKRKKKKLDKQKNKDS